MDRPLNKRQQQYQKTLEAIRAAVDKLVREVGFDDMRVKDICREVGISSGAFYHYFESKDELLFDRFRRANEAAAVYYEETLSTMNEVDALKAYIDYNVEYVRSRVLGVLTQYRKTLLTYYKKWTTVEPDGRRAILSLLLEKGVKNGTIRTEYPLEEIAWFLQENIQGAAELYVMTQGDYFVTGHSTRIVKDFIESLRAL